ncbi:hypothetical protein FHX15_006227, partial [Rhizobium sp. BK650]|nr:hypothetical protein [Rhizobium sp. BK650]
AAFACRASMQTTGRSIRLSSCHSQLDIAPVSNAPDVDVPMFAPAVLDVPTTPVAKEQESPRAARRKSGSGAIELELGGAIIRIASGTDTATITAVIHAVKAQS